MVEIFLIGKLNPSKNF